MNDRRKPKWYQISITRDEQGKHKLNRVISFAAFLVLSAVFIKQAWTRDVNEWEYLTYSVGAAFSYAPTLAIDALRLIRDIKSAQNANENSAVPTQAPATIEGGA